MVAGTRAGKMTPDEGPEEPQNCRRWTLPASHLPKRKHRSRHVAEWPARGLGTCFLLPPHTPCQDMGQFSRLRGEPVVSEHVGMSQAGDLVYGRGGRSHSRNATQRNKNRTVS